MYLPLYPNQFLPGILPGVFSPLARSWSSRCFPGGHIPFGRSFNFQASPEVPNAFFHSGKQFCPYSTT